MQIRKSRPEDLASVLKIYDGARKFMRENGNPTQWKDWYPPADLIEKDLLPDAHGYVCEENGEIVAVFYYNIERDPTYEVIDGAWLNDRPCGALHRIAAKQGAKGAGTFCINWAFEQCGNLKIDTHEDNAPMRALLAKLGFIYCGIIWVLNGTEERIAFQKTIREEGYVMYDLEKLGERAKKSSRSLALLGTDEKNKALAAISAGLKQDKEKILAANRRDLENAEKSNMPQAMRDRLLLTESRISSIAAAVLEVAALPDPVGKIEKGFSHKNGMQIIKKTVPFGVIGVIYESRPNVTADVAVLCLKSGSAVILRGGSDAFNSNMAIAESMRAALESAGLDPDYIQLVEDTGRAAAERLMKLDKYLDLLIPRGGAGLISSVVQNSTVPVIETGTGNCHLYVEKSADVEMALNILENSKCSRVSVCNSLESLLVDEGIAAEFLPLAKARLDAHNVEWRVCEKCSAILGGSAKAATESDYATEFLDYIISAKAVSGIDEAIEHIGKYSTHHSDAIVTRDYGKAQKFLNEVDSAAVYVNASTRFTDGGEFGFGAEIGISTQKLHARGPMGIEALCSYKYIIYGDGQVR